MWKIFDTLPASQAAPSVRTHDPESPGHRAQTTNDADPPRSASGRFAVSQPDALPFRRAAALLLGLLLAGLGCAGCASTPAPERAEPHGAATQPAGVAVAAPAPFGLFAPPPRRGGAQLWAENCSRCHSVRPPNYHSADEWAIILQHMRLRADLTGEEQRRVTEFLQGGS